jgi:hypothetical protein
MDELTEDIGVFQNEMCEIIETCLSVLVTLSEIDANTYDSEQEHIIKVKTQAYSVIHAAQAKLLKDIKPGRSNNIS